MGERRGEIRWLGTTLDSLELIDGANDGLTNEEKRSALALWVLSNAPITLGGDLRNMDAFGKQLLTNDEVLAVDKTGRPAKQRWMATWKSG